MSGQKSIQNSTTIPLSGGATFNANGLGQRSGLSDVMVTCSTDQDGVLYFDFSEDGVNWTSFPTQGFVVVAGEEEFHTAVKGPRIFRARYVNGAIAQTEFRLDTFFGSFRQNSAPLNETIHQDSDAVVTRTDDPDAVMQGKIEGEYIIEKYARNPEIDTATVPEDVWNGGGLYTGFPTASPEQFEVLSDDPVDTSAGTGAQTVRFFYFDDDYNLFDANGDFLFFDVSMNGTTGVSVGNPTGMRIWRGKVLTSGSGQTNAGGITCRWKTTTAAVFAIIPATFGQTSLSNFTIPEGYTGYLKQYSVTMDDSPSTNRAEMAIVIRDFGSNTFRNTRPFTLIGGIPYSPPKLYGAVELFEKTDFVFRVLSVASNGAIVTAMWSLRLIQNAH